MNLTKSAENITLVSRLVTWRARLSLALWAVVAVAFLTVFAVDLPLSYRQMAAPCAGAYCHYQAITVAEAQVLSGWGLSVSAYALYMLGISVMPVVVTTILAGLTLVRLYPQSRAFLFSLMIIAIPITAITNFDVVSAAFTRLANFIPVMVILGHWLLITFFLVFPRSRFEPGWTVIIPFIAAFFGFYSLFLANHFKFPITQPYTVLLILVASIIIYRYRQLFDRIERRQAKWVVLGMLVFFTGVPLWTYLFEIATPATGREALLVVLAGWTLLMLITLFLPATIFIAIFRHRLWDIDIILNRTLVYGGLSIGIVATYMLVVGGLGALLHAQDNFVLALLATTLIAVLFYPARERLQRGVNRLMFGERDDPYAVLSRLGQQLRDTPLPEQVLPAIVETLTQVLKLPYAAIDLISRDGRQSVASSGKDVVYPLQEWPLLYQGDTVGWLKVATRSSKEEFTAKERRLFEDIAAQAGAAAYSLRLTNALQKSRERLVLAREEERRRIRRDLHDELGPALASQTFKLDAAIDLLASDPAAASELLLSLKVRTQQLVADIRRLVYELRPPAMDELGLLGALRAHAGQLPLTILITATPDPLPALPAAVEVAAYRITLEALNNVVRHAGASSGSVTLSVENIRLVLTIEDNGRGLPAGSNKGIGLTSMRERAEEVGGKLSIDTLSTGGTRVQAVLPLQLHFGS